MAIDCTCFWTDPSTWTRYYGAVDPGSQMEPNPECQYHFPKTEPFWGAKAESNSVAHFFELEDIKREPRLWLSLCGRYTTDHKFESDLEPGRKYCGDCVSHLAKREANDVGSEG